MKTAREWQQENHFYSDDTSIIEAIQRDALEAAAKLVDGPVIHDGRMAAIAIRALIPQSD